MIASKISYHDQSEVILTSIVLSEGIFKFRHTLLVTKNLKLIGQIILIRKKLILVVLSKNIHQLNPHKNI